MISRAITHPLDTLRVLQSVSSHSPSAELVAGTQQEVPVLQRLSAATGHWVQTVSRAVSDGRGILRTATFNWHQLHGLEANPVYDTLQLRQSVAILYRGYGVSVFGAQPVYGAYFASYEASRLAPSAPSIRLKHPTSPLTLTDPRCPWCAPPGREGQVGRHTAFGLAAIIPRAGRAHNACRLRILCRHHLPLRHLTRG